MREDRQDEKKIIKGILGKDEICLRQFYRKYYPSLMTYINNKIDNQNDVEEILQDTLLATIEALRDFAHKCSLFTFICSIANHKVIDHYRKKKIKSILFSKIPEIEPLLSTLLNPDSILDDELLKQKIKETFDKLAPKHRTILKLKYIYGYTVAEIAGELSTTFKSVESQLFRARKAFTIIYLYE